MFGLKLYIGLYESLEVEGRGGETQFQVGENLTKVT